MTLNDDAEMRAISCAFNERLMREKGSSEEELRAEVASLKKELERQKRELELLRSERAAAVPNADDRTNSNLPRVTRVEEVKMDLGSIRKGTRSAGRKNSASQGRGTTGDEEGECTWRRS